MIQTTNTTMSDFTRELGDQSKIPENSEPEDNELMTMQRAENMAKQYESIKDRTVDENTVLGQLKDINTSENNDRIIVSIDIPAQEKPEDFRFRKPRVWTDKYKFVRWIKHYGYDADSFPSMLEDDCKVKVDMDDGAYTLFIPEEETSLSDKFDELKNIKGWGEKIKYWYLTAYIPISGILFIGAIFSFIAWIMGIINFSASRDAVLFSAMVLLFTLGSIALWEENRMSDLKEKCQW